MKTIEELSGNLVSLSEHYREVRKGVPTLPDAEQYYFVWCRLHSFLYCTPDVFDARDFMIFSMLEDMIHIYNKPVKNQVQKINKYMDSIYAQMEVYLQTGTCTIQYLYKDDYRIEKMSICCFRKDVARAIVVEHMMDCYII